jgi:hypothetical protein
VRTAAITEWLSRHTILRGVGALNAPGLLRSKVAVVTAAAVDQ